MPLPPFDELLEESIALHGGHGCPGQVLGVKLAMVGLREIGIDDRVAQRKQFLVYVELDRCAADAIQAATGCRVGRRALKVIDYGVMAATFVRLDEDRAVRAAILSVTDAPARPARRNALSRRCTSRRMFSSYHLGSSGCTSGIRTFIRGAISISLRSARRHAEM